MLIFLVSDSVITVLQEQLSENCFLVKLIIIILSSILPLKYDNWCQPAGKIETKIPCKIQPNSFLPDEVLQNRRYQQAAEIGNVASSTLCMRNGDVIRKGDFIICMLCLLYFFYHKDEQRKPLGIFSRVVYILPQAFNRTSPPEDRLLRSAGRSLQ